RTSAQCGSRRRRGEIERRVPAIMSESWRSNPMCGVKGLSVLALRQAVFETCLPKGDRAISLIGAGSKPASALRKLSAFGVSVLSLRRDRVIRPVETPIRGDHRLPFAPNPA